jgi:hypothetical protein
MMPVIPYKHFCISTALTIEQAVSLVSSAISPRRTIDNWSASISTEFEGSVTEQGFKIQKIIHNRNSFLPVLYGKFIQTRTGTKVDVHLTLDALIMVFACVWLTGFGGVFLWLVSSSITTGKWDHNAWYLLAGFTFFYLMIFFGFGLYAKTTEEFIINLFSRHKIEKM